MSRISILPPEFRDVFRSVPTNSPRDLLAMIFKRGVFGFLGIWSGYFLIQHLENRAGQRLDPALMFLLFTLGSVIGDRIDAQFKIGERIMKGIDTLSGKGRR